MMILAELIKYFVCPEDRSSLTIVGEELLGRCNAAIRQGQLCNRAGQKLEKPLSGGLLRADQTVFYPIVDGIPMMLVEEAVPLAQPALAGNVAGS